MEKLFSGTIYHYCDTNALLSIIKEKKLWLSSLDMMNDTGELRFFREKLIPHIQSELIKLGAPFQYFDLILNEIKKHEFYAVCFSTEDDDLYQWQSYGDKGQGFALGFSARKLCRGPVRSLELEISPKKIFSGALSSPEKGGLCLAKVHYANDKDVDDWAKSIALALKTYTPLMPLNDEWKEYAQLILIVAQVVKSERFKAENEHRLIYSPFVTYDEKLKRNVIAGPLTQLKWRNGRYGITPYFEYSEYSEPKSFDKYGVTEAFERVIVGPNSKESDLKNLRSLLREHGFEHVEVRTSKVTFR